jgi:ubiquinone/menaquinone biosynthesis C-methylase UbiE
MGSSAYHNPRLARVYDTLNPPTPDLDFYERLAGSECKTILDVGSGTGRFACRLAALGHDVVGAEPAEGMLGVARNRPGGEQVKWVQATATELKLKERFDLIVMTGHVFQVFTTDKEILAVLRNLRVHLKCHGRLAFETRNPLAREWEQWIPTLTREVLRIEGEGQVIAHNDIHSVVGELVTYETHFQFADGSRYIALDTLRFLAKDRLAAFLSGASFDDVKWHGNWDGGPFTPTSAEVIVVTRR